MDTLCRLQSILGPRFQVLPLCTIHCICDPEHVSDVSVNLRGRSNFTSCIGALSSSAMRVMLCLLPHASRI